MSEKVFIPELKEGGYVLFKKEVLLWESLTKLDEKERAGNILFKLPHDAKIEAFKLSPDELANGVTVDNNGTQEKVTGVKRLLEVLDGIYLEDLNKEKYKAYLEFRSFKRLKDQTVPQFLIKYDAKKRALEEHGIKLPEEIYAFELLASCNLSPHLESIANATVSDLTYQSMKGQIKKVAQTSGNKLDSGELMTVVKEDTGFFAEQVTFTNDIHEVDQPEGESEVFYTYRGPFRGRNTGRGRYYYRSKPQARGNNNNTDNQMPNNTSINKGKNRGGGRGNAMPRGRKNPIDQYGNQMTCLECGSWYHFVRNCPEANQTHYVNHDQVTENITLFQNTHDLSTMPPSNKLKIFTKENFGSAVLDSGANTTVCGKDWLRVYLESLDEDEKKKVRTNPSNVNFRFGDNEATTSNEQYLIPAVVCGKEITIATEVVEDNIPLLISKQTMANAKMIINFGENTVSAFGQTQNMKQSNTGHCSIPLKRISVNNETCLCTQGEVMVTTVDDIDKAAVATKLHKQFGHPRAEALKSLLRAAGKSDNVLFKEIDKLSESCVTCLRYKVPEPRPIVCLPLATEFNDTVSMDLKVYDFAKGIYFQHMIDTHTRFSSAKVIRSKSKETLIEAIFTHWISILGRPRRFMSDNGGEYNNANFQDMCEKLGVHVITTGAEAPWSNGIVERHHTLIARNVQKIQEETNCRVETALAWAINSKNAMSNINGFSPYQLVLGQNPKVPDLDDPYAPPTILNSTTPSEKVAEHMKAIYSARKNHAAKDADERIRRALLHKTRDVKSKNLSQGDKAFYKRNESNEWKGPGTIIGIDGNVVFIRHGGMVIKSHICRVTKVQDFIENQNKSQSDNGCDSSTSTATTESNDVFFNARKMMQDSLKNDSKEKDQEHSIQDAELEADIVDHIQEDNTKIQKLCDAKNKHSKKQIQISLVKDDPFKQEKIDEIEKWKVNDVFEEIAVDMISDQEFYPITVGWVTKDDGKKRKARLVAHGYQEEPIGAEHTKSPTCRKESLRLLLSITASMQWDLVSLDITSAFLQGRAIDRNVFIIPPKEVRKPGTLWRLKKCVYGLSDAARMWYEEVKDQVQMAGIDRCPHDDAFFYRKDGSGKSLEGIMGIHVDDFLSSGTPEFREILEKCALRNFEVGSREEHDFVFLGLQISQNPISKEITISQKDYIVNELQKIQINPKRQQQKFHALTKLEFDQYKSACGKLQWLSTQSRPDISFDVCQLNNHLSDPNIQDLNALNKLIKRLKDNPDVKITFRPLDLSSIKLKVYSDAAFNNLPNLGSQCGFIIFITDESGTKTHNPVTWKSLKIDRVCQSARGAETLGLAKAVDHAIFVQGTLQEVLGKDKTIPIECYIDSKALYDNLMKTKDPEEKKLIRVLAPIQDSINKGEISVIRISSKEMPADILTKRGVNPHMILKHLSQNDAEDTSDNEQ